MMQMNVGVMEAKTVSLASRVSAELLKINRMLAIGGQPLNKNGRRPIGPTQERILAFLFSRSRDPVTLTSLAEGAALSLATASETVKGLESRGFVRKARSKDDARVVFLSLSAAGRRKAEQAAAGSHHLNAAIERLTYKEQELVLRTLKNIQQVMDSGRER